MTKPQNILVIGASGFLGRNIVDFLQSYTSVICTHRSHSMFPASLPYDFFCDDIRAILDAREVSTVIFAALVEMAASDDVHRAMTRFIRGCQDQRVIYLSSDGIFGGTRGMYAEHEVPFPRTHYGNNLLLCENLFTQYCRNFCIIRPSYIYGFSHGILDKRLARTRKALLAGECVQVFHDMYKSPLGVAQVAEAVVTLSDSRYIGTVHVAGDRMSVFDFHQQAMTALGIDTTQLIPCSMPVEQGFLQDTSLNTALWQQLTGMRPMSVQETLSQNILSVNKRER